MATDCPESCRQFLVDQFAELGVDAVVSQAPPIVETPYTGPPMICPHGETFWFEPTTEQIAQWATDGVQ